eukprot:PhF_6_TR27333/c0_g1_i2/m.40163
MSQDDKILRGKYKRLINPQLREAVEYHYNHQMLPAQRRAFKTIVRSIYDHMESSLNESPPPVIEEHKIIQANCLLETHTPDVFAPNMRFYVVSWLCNASNNEILHFRDTFCKIHGLKLFNGKSETKIAYDRKLIHRTAENVRKRELDHLMRAQRAAELVGNHHRKNENEEDQLLPPVSLPQHQLPPQHVLQKAHDGSVHGAPWGTLFLHSEV